MIYFFKFAKFTGWPFYFSASDKLHIAEDCLFGK